MERSESNKKRSEQALVPEWLKGASSGVTASGGGSSLHHFASSFRQDDHAAGLPLRSRSSVSSSDHDSPRSSAFGDRTSSSYFRRSSSSNGSVMHDKEPTTHSWNYSSFSRNHRDRDWDKDLDFQLGDSRVRDYSNSLTSANILTSRIDKDTLRRSKSMISGKRGEVWPGRVGNFVSNGLHTGANIASNVHRYAFDRDFPTLGAEEKQGVPDISRGSSPGLSPASQSLPMGTMSVIGGDAWTSALAELPAMVGSNSTTLSSSQQSTSANSAAVLPSTSTGLNMAETLAQAPSRARTLPQISIETQRLEELAMKQCRQLIPMTPSMPKTLALNSLDKAKTKVARTGEVSTGKVGQPSSPHLVGNIRGSVRSDTSKASQVGKLQPLKGPREDNGVSHAAKDGSISTNSSRPSHGGVQKCPSNQKLSSDLKLVTSTASQSSPMERKTLPQAQNRIDFFNSLRKKASVNHSAATPDLIPAVSSVPGKSDEPILGSAATVTDSNDTPASVPDLESMNLSAKNGTDVGGNGDASEDSEIFADDGEKNSGSDAVVIPDEEEAAFLRRLGWEENAKYEALTEEEISAFYNEHKEKRLSSRLCQRMQQSKIVPLGSCIGSMGGASSGLTSSNSESKA